MTQMTFRKSIAHTLAALVALGSINYSPRGLSLGADQAQAQLVTEKRAMLGPNRLLRKISRKIRGIDPSEAEYASLLEVLAVKDEAQIKDFYKERTAEYLKDPRHFEKMVLRVANLVNVEGKHITYLGNAPLIENTDYSTVFQALVSRMVENNLSWDSLLTDRSYELGEDDRYTLGNLVTSKVITKEEYYFGSKLQRPSFYTSYAEYPDSELQVAGILSTSTWRKRFTVDNESNENRRNASALFRVFLCDPMVPEVESNKDLDGSAIKTLLDSQHAKLQNQSDAVSTANNSNGLNDSKKVFTQEEIKEAVAQKHGTDASCMGCHVKLDPAGLAFGSTSKTLSSSPKEGRLFFKYGDEQVSDVAFVGLRGLAKEIIKTDRYSSCQVEHFWKWFVSREFSERPIPERMEELKKKFDESGRKVNDFIAHLVLSPEFAVDFGKESLTEEEIAPTYEQVKPLLNRCDSCHGSEGYIFTNVTLPNKGTEADKKRLTEMYRRLTLESGHKDSMPKSRGSWQEEEINAIRLWLKSELE